VGTYRYPEEFRRNAVEPVRLSDRPIAHIASEIGGNHEMLRSWVRAAEKAERPQAITQAAKDTEIVRLCKENAELKQERDILRKAAAYFAQEMRP
jgi:transposase